MSVLSSRTPLPQYSVLTLCVDAQFLFHAYTVDTFAWSAGSGGIEMMMMKLVVIMLMVATMVPTFVNAGPGTYAHYEFGNLADGNDISPDMEVSHVWVAMPTPFMKQGNAVFASTQYWTESGVGGYMGTQVWLDKKSGKEVHKVIFSMWDANATTHTVGMGAGCGRFGGEASGDRGGTRGADRGSGAGGGGTGRGRYRH